MEENLYEIVTAEILKYPDNGKIVFENSRLRRNEIFRGLAKNWKVTANDGFGEFLKINKISPKTPIAIAKDVDSFAVIQIIDFRKKTGLLKTIILAMKKVKVFFMK